MTRPSPASMLAGGAFFAGAIGVVSALTPEIASRSDFVRGVLPPGVPTAARVLTLAFGLVLVWLARSLARRKRRAWQLAVFLVVASAVAHLAKGLDFEEAIVTLALLAALWRWRREFDVPGDAAAIPALVSSSVALGALGIVARMLSLPDALADALGVLAFVLAFRLVSLWLRPLAERVLQTPAQRVRAESLVRAYGRDSLAFFKLRRDASWFFSESGRAFLAYRVAGATAVVSGDPVGPPEELEALFTRFRAHAHAHGWRVAVLDASAAVLDDLQGLGFHVLYLGDEAVVRPDWFTLNGRAVRKVRQSVARLERAGYKVRLVRAGDADDGLRAQIRRVSRECLGPAPERGFAMAIDDVLAHPDCVLAIAEREGRIGGFLHLVPSHDGWSLSTMRRDPATPNGLMEFIVVRTVEWAREAGASEVSLNFAVLADVLRAGPGTAYPKRALRALLLHLDAMFQLERLHGFSRKFQPEWRPRYVCVESWPQLPGALFACLRAESLLAPLRWWDRAAW